MFILHSSFFILHRNIGTEEEEPSEESRGQFKAASAANATHDIHGDQDFIYYYIILATVMTIIQGLINRGYIFTIALICYSRKYVRQSFEFPLMNTMGGML